MFCVGVDYGYWIGWVVFCVYCVVVVVCFGDVENFGLMIVNEGCCFGSKVFGYRV